jgi:4,5-DOPA dioxygenase extradiol
MTPRTIAPTLFVSHGAPTAAVADDDWSRALRAFGRCASIEGVVVLSAHAERPGPVVVGRSARNVTLHDFGGFPRALYQLRYDAPGNPELAAGVVRSLAAAGIPAVEGDVPLDHGAWVPLRHLLPETRTPIVPITLPAARTPAQVQALGRALAPLRERGVLLLGSGGLVHDLSRLAWDDASAPPPAWATSFDRWVAERLERGADADLLDYRARAEHAADAAPSTEHLDPLFFVLGARRPGDRVETLHAGFQLGSLSMRTFALTDHTNDDRRSS